MGRHSVSSKFLSLLTLGAASLIFSLVTPASESAFPKIIPLPDGFQPEGVVIGRGDAIFAGSIGNGAIYEADLRTGDGGILVAGQPGRQTAGLGFDNRTNYIFAAGTLAGTGTVYDAGSGALVQEYQLTPAFFPLINDVIVTQDGAYFTNSFAPEIYRLPLGPGGELPATTAVETIPLTGEFDFVPGFFVFNANGIVVSADGDHLIVINSTTETLYRVDSATGDTIRVDLGGVLLPNGDGLVLLGNSLYVVQNALNQIAVIDMDNGLTSGTVIDTITDGDFRSPTTAARFGASLYAVNAVQIGGTPPPTTTEYEIVKVPR